MVRNAAGTVTGCPSKIDVAGTGIMCGGLIGLNNATVSKCYETGDVTSTGSLFGGSIGMTGKANVSECYATGNITDGSGAGGLIEGGGE